MVPETRFKSSQSTSSRAAPVSRDGHSAHMVSMDAQPDAPAKVEHYIIDNDPRQVPLGSGTCWVASCICGDFICKPQQTFESAVKEAYKHIRSAFRRHEARLMIEHDAQNNTGNTLRSGLQTIIDMPGVVTKERLTALLAAHPE